MKIKEVYENRVLIEITLSEEGEYLLPESHEPDVELSGRVAFIGEETTKTTVGDIVVFGQFDYSKVSIKGVGYILTKEDNLICKLEENE
jgi:co-chaperonin GroES (HSP10)